MPTGVELEARYHDQLRSIVGTTHVLVDPEVVAGFTTDWTGRFRGSSPAVVRPGSVDEVAAVLAASSEARVAVVPQGGNTGLVGGGVPMGGEVVLALTRLTELGPVDHMSAQVTAGAGVTLEHLQTAARAAGLAYAVDLTARDSATVGGMVATNAGGMHFLRWGGTRQQLVGIEAVLADGRILRHLGGLLKDNTGYDVPGLICGSEGTLAVVTAARLRLIEDPVWRIVALLAFETIADAVGAVSGWRHDLDGLIAAELVLGGGVELVCAYDGRPPPFATDWPTYVLLEVAARDDPTDRVASVIGECEAVRDVAVASGDRRRRELWSYREDHSVAINALSAPHKLDVTIPLGKLADFAASVPGRVASVAPSSQVWLFGHIADGNLHVNVTGVEPDDETVDDAVLQLVAELGGSISAEHGIGIAKRRWLHLSRTREEIDLFRTIKSALDPNGILNPAVLLPSGPGAIG